MANFDGQQWNCKGRGNLGIASFHANKNPPFFIYLFIKCFRFCIGWFLKNIPMRAKVVTRLERKS